MCDERGSAACVDCFINLRASKRIGSAPSYTNAGDLIALYLSSYSKHPAEDAHIHTPYRLQRGIRASETTHAPVFVCAVPCRGQ